MKKFSITAKITTWYAIFLIVISMCFLVITLWAGERQTINTVKTELMDEVSGVQGEILNREGEMEFKSSFDLYDDGVYISMYDMSGNLYEGKIPVAAYDQPKFEDGGLSELVDDNGVTWYIYDRLFKVEGEKVWIRGIMKETMVSNAIKETIKLGTLGLPILLIIAILGGFIFTKRSFRPIKKVIQCVEGIQEDGDFSRRIDVDVQLSESNDEINELSAKFNGMFDTIEESFQKEKQFTSDVSHELRTPLASIIAQSDYALSDESYAAEALKKINKEAKNMADLVSKLLVISRGDSKRIVTEKSIINLSEICETICEQQKDILNDEITFEENIEGNVHILADETMVIRMILNLLDNAFKYGINQNGEKTIVRLELKTTGVNKVICSVSDNGPGIPEGEIDKIWDRLYRADRSRTKEGYGLGLSLVKAMATANDAKVYAMSQMGKGSTFFVEFDIAGGIQ